MTLTRIVESGYDLTSLEMSALRATDASVWSRAAEQIDSRLQKASLGGPSNPRLVRRSRGVT
jgi:hypothetical protein